MIKNQPYTYLIGWSKYDTWYYGVRYSKDCHPDDLWVTYFTSSKMVKNFYIKNGEPDVIQIRKLFSSVKLAQQWEVTVLKRMKVVESKQWLNQNDRLAPPVLAGDKNPSRRKDLREKMNIGISNAWTDERRKQQSERWSGENNPMFGTDQSGENNPTFGMIPWNKGLQMPETVCQKLSDAWTPERKAKHSKNQTGEKNHMFGKEQTVEHRQKNSDAHAGGNNAMYGLLGEDHPAFGTKRKRVICEYCGENVAVNTYGRNHGNKCKMYSYEMPLAQGVKFEVD